MAFARCCKWRTIPFFTLYEWWDLKLRYCPVKVGLRYIDDQNPCSVRVTNTSRKDNLLSCSFSIVNSTDGRIEFTRSSNVWTSSWWSQRMNVSSTYLSHIDGFSDVDPNVLSSKYSMYMLAITGDDGGSHNQFFLSVYIKFHTEVGCLYTESQQFHKIIYRDVGAFFLQEIRGQFISYHSKCLISRYLWEQSYNIQIRYLVGMNGGMTNSLHEVGRVLCVWWGLTGYGADDLHKETAQWVTCWTSVTDNGSQWNTILVYFWKTIYVWYAYCNVELAVCLFGGGVVVRDLYSYWGSVTASFPSLESGPSLIYNCHHCQLSPPMCWSIRPNLLPQ